MRFDNQVAVVTGAGSGLGRAYALALAERGAKVALIDSGCTEPECQQACPSGLRDSYKAVKALGEPSLMFHLDVCDIEGVNRAIDEIVTHWGRVDILINNAGIHTACDFDNLTTDMWHQQLNTDLNGSFYMTKAVWPHMKRQDHGRVIMSCGASGLYGDMYEASYSASKMGLIGLVNSLSLEGVDYNIMVNSITPHALTSMTAHHLATSVRPLFSKPSITACMMFLCSSKAPSGQHLLAAAGSVSHGQIAEFKPCYFPGATCKPEAIASNWQNIHQAQPVKLHRSGEEQVLAWAQRGAGERHIMIE